MRPSCVEDGLGVLVEVGVTVLLVFGGVVGVLGTLMQ
jgi:hypothetical protein